MTSLCKEGGLGIPQYYFLSFQRRNQSLHFVVSNALAVVRGVEGGLCPNGVSHGTNDELHVLRREMIFHTVSNASINEVCNERVVILACSTG